MAYEFMKANENEYTIKEMAGFFGVSRRADYRWAKEGVSTRRKETDAELILLYGRLYSGTIIDTAAHGFGVSYVLSTGKE
jgi:hypothetical protein